MLHANKIMQKNDRCNTWPFFYLFLNGAYFIPKEMYLNGFSWRACNFPANPTDNPGC